MFSHPELGSDQPIESGRESGRDKLLGIRIPKLRYQAMTLVSISPQ